MWKLFIAGAVAGPALPPAALRPPQTSRAGAAALRGARRGIGAPAQRGQSNYWETGLVGLRVLLLSSHPLFSVCIFPEQGVWRCGDHSIRILGFGDGSNPALPSQEAQSIVPSRARHGRPGGWELR